MKIPFENSFAELGPNFSSLQRPTPVSNPELLLYNNDLSDLLGIEIDDPSQILDVFSGNMIPKGAAPLAQLYAGHQFGNYNPQLGDGRAILLGETVGIDGERRDIQLKGAGPTPYSRMGDGRAWLGPVLREYIVSEAMHALGIPTTRALAAIKTGDTIQRETVLPGAIITRIASSHLRVGTFQVFAHRGQLKELTALTQYAIDRHYPSADGPLGLLAAVCDAQAELIASWMSVGFIHGVMNTDNCAISGETIDYGPCAFMDHFHIDTVYSSIDKMGRFAYGNQPRIAVWNMAQLATSLIQQMDNPEDAAEAATQIVHAMPAAIEAAWLRKFAAKIGIPTPSPTDKTLVDRLLALMQKDRSDFTNVFDALTSGDAHAEFTSHSEFSTWHSDWLARTSGIPDANALMQITNPRIILRNHRIEEMIQAALVGDLDPMHRLNKALQTPFSCDDADLRRPPKHDQIVPATFCGT